MTTLVCVPYYDCEGYVTKCVRSILAQTDRDIHVVVIGDGQIPPLRVADSRLEVYVLPTNHGPYFAQQLALLASPHRWFAPHGADDYSDPDHLERLHALGGDAVITGAVWWHQNGTVKLHEARYEVGLFARERLLAIGGHNPAERIGQDSLLIRLLDLTGPLCATHSPTYHRVKRPGSLMSAYATRPGSPARNEMRARNRAVLLNAQILGETDKIRDYRLGIVPRIVADDLAEHVERLRVRLGEPVTA